MTIPRQWAFERSEYDRRVEAVRALMASQDVDVLVCFSAANIYYLSGLDDESLADLQAVILPIDADPLLVQFWFEAGRAANTSWIDRIVTYSGDEGVATVAASIRGLAPRRVAIDTGDGISITDFARLQALLDGGTSTYVDGFGLVERARLTKSSAEIRYLIEAAAISDRAVVAGLAVIREGVVDREAAAAVMSILYGEGDPIPFGPIIAAGFRSGTPHSTFAGDVVRSGEPVFFELTAARRRYTAPLMRMAIVGRPSVRAQAIADAGSAAIDAVLQTARAGIAASTVARAALTELKPVLTDLAFHNTIGYPVGAGFPLTWVERLGFLIREENDRPLEAGMSFHLPISIRSFGSFGICQSETILITENGAEALTRSPRILHVA